MNKTLIILLLLIGIECNSQDFEGIITYEVKIENPNPELMSDSLFFSKSQNTYIEKYYYKGNKYKSVATINGEKETELYDPINQRLYTYDQDEDIASWTDTTKRLDEIIGIKKSEKTIQLLEMNCKALAFGLKNGIMFFIYSDEITISAELFKEHKYNFWFDFLNITNAIPLKIKVQTQFENRTLTAINIEKMKLSDDEFKVPKFEQIIKSLN
jgi:hypothetical protein